MTIIISVAISVVISACFSLYMTTKSAKALGVQVQKVLAGTKHDISND